MTDFCTLPLSIRTSLHSLVFYPTKGAIAAGFSVGYCLGLLPTGAAASAGSPKAVLLGSMLEHSKPFWSVLSHSKVF